MDFLFDQTFTFDHPFTFVDSQPDPPGLPLNALLPSEIAAHAMDLQPQMQAELQMQMSVTDHIPLPDTSLISTTFLFDKPSGVYLPLASTNSTFAPLPLSLTPVASDGSADFYTATNTRPHIQRMSLMDMSWRAQSHAQRQTGRGAKRQCVESTIDETQRIVELDSDLEEYDTRAGRKRKVHAHAPSSTVSPSQVTTTPASEAISIGGFASPAAPSRITIAAQAHLDTYMTFREQHATLAQLLTLYEDPARIEDEWYAVLTVAHPLLDTLRTITNNVPSYPPGDVWTAMELAESIFSTFRVLAKRFDDAQSLQSDSDSDFEDEEDIFAPQNNPQTEFPVGGDTSTAQPHSGNAEPHVPAGINVLSMNESDAIEWRRMHTDHPPNTQGIYSLEGELDSFDRLIPAAQARMSAVAMGVDRHPDAAAQNTFVSAAARDQSMGIAPHIDWDALEARLNEDPVYAHFAAQARDSDDESLSSDEDEDGDDASEGTPEPFTNTALTMFFDSYDELNAELGPIWDALASAYRVDTSGLDRQTHLSLYVERERGRVAEESWSKRDFVAVKPTADVSGVVDEHGRVIFDEEGWREWATRNLDW